MPGLFEGIVEVIPPVAEGGDKRRTYQATLDKPAQLGSRRHSAANTKQ